MKKSIQKIYSNYNYNYNYNFLSKCFDFLIEQGVCLAINESYNGDTLLDYVLFGVSFGTQKENVGEELIGNLKLKKNLSDIKLTTEPTAWTTEEFIEHLCDRNSVIAKIAERIYLAVKENSEIGIKGAAKFSENKKTDLFWNKLVEYGHLVHIARNPSITTAYNLLQEKSQDEKKESNVIEKEETKEEADKVAVNFK